VTSSWFFLSTLYIRLCGGNGWKHSSFIKRQKCPPYSPTRFIYTSVSALLIRHILLHSPQTPLPNYFHCLLWVQLTPLSHSHRTNRTAFFIHCNLRHLLSQTNHFYDSQRHKPDALSLIYSATPFEMQHVSLKREWTSGMYTAVEMLWHTFTQGSGVKGGKCRMEWVASTRHTTSEHGVSSITTADAAHLRLPAVDWTDAYPPGRFKWTRPFRAKNEIWFLRVRHHISEALYKAGGQVCRQWPQSVKDYCYIRNQSLAPTGNTRVPIRTLDPKAYNKCLIAVFSDNPQVFRKAITMLCNRQRYK
jgi:hypothetical protein